METSLIDNIKNFFTEINKKYNIDYGYLFGSTAKGTQRVDSDIDIAIKFTEDYSDKKDLFIRGEIIDLGKTYFKKDVDIISLDRATIALKYEVVKNGILIKDSDTRSTFESLVLREYFDFRYYSDIYNEKIIANIKNESFFEEQSYGT